MRDARVALDKANKAPSSKRTPESITEQQRQLSATKTQLIQAKRAAEEKILRYQQLENLTKLFQTESLLQDFPSGVFAIHTDDSHTGDNSIARTIFYDDVLRGYVEDYPDIIEAFALEHPDLLSQDTVAHLQHVVLELKEKRAESRLKGIHPRWRPGVFNSWRPTY